MYHVGRRNGITRCRKSFPDKTIHFRFYAHTVEVDSSSLSPPTFKASCDNKLRLAFSAPFQPAPFRAPFSAPFRNTTGRDRNGAAPRQPFEKRCRLAGPLCSDFCVTAGGLALLPSARSGRIVKARYWLMGDQAPPCFLLLKWLAEGGPEQEPTCVVDRPRQILLLVVLIIIRIVLSECALPFRGEWPSQRTLEVRGRTPSPTSLEGQSVPRCAAWLMTTPGRG